VVNYLSRLAFLYAHRRTRSCALSYTHQHRKILRDPGATRPGGRSAEEWAIHLDFGPPLYQVDYVTVNLFTANYGVPVNGAKVGVTTGRRLSVFGGPASGRLR